MSKHCDSVTVFTTHICGYYRQLQASFCCKSHFGAELTAEITADLLLLYWPKATQKRSFYWAKCYWAKLPAHTAKRSSPGEKPPRWMTAG
ncbi:hypothetical protein ACT691_12660 [Vibrio metschnikovii]